MNILNRLLRVISFHEQDNEYPYLVEIRPMLEKYRIKRQIREIMKTTHIRRWHRVPHITLIYNFRPRKSVKNWDLAKIIQDVTSKYGIVKFYYDGFELKKGKKGYVLAFRIKPSSKLKKLRKELYDRLKPLIEGRPDIVDINSAEEDEFWFHATIGYRMSEKEYRRAKDAIQLFKREYFPAYALRIPLLKHSKISYEIDTPTGRILTRREALSRKAYIETVKTFRKKFDVEPSNPLYISSNPEKNKIWLISDTHFDHANIIKYCARPFADVKEMNKVLVKNWNSTVKDNDTVYFLGDISFGKHSRSSYYWIGKLKGRITYIRGNHERQIGEEHELLEYGEYRFLLIHNPKDVNFFDGWIIHGHEHNNKLRDYPFINGEKRTINVSAEVINYKPVSLDWILSLGLKKIRRMETVLDEPEYW